MKRLSSLMILLLMFFTKTVFALNTVNGLYLTYQDYVAHRLSYTGMDTKIALNEFFGQSYITISGVNKKERLAKKDVYGFRQNGQDYRFFKGKSFRIMDTVGFYLYMREKISPSGKKLMPTQFFSTKGDNGVSPLTIQNVSSAFAKNHQFKYEVSLQFKNDDELMEFDETEKAYKLKVIYLENHK